MRAVWPCRAVSRVQNLIAEHCYICRFRAISMSAWAVLALSCIAQTSPGATTMHDYTTLHMLQSALKFRNCLARCE